MSCGHSSLFIFGLGYSTTGLARQAQERGWSVTSTSRQPERFARAASRLHTVVRFDPAARLAPGHEVHEALRRARYAVTSIPPVAARLYDPVLAAQHALLRAVVETGDCHLSGIGYLSSTGVYGDWAGEWVDESAETRTATARGLLRLEAEQAWSALARQLKLNLTVFRLGGIYGPRRSVFDSITRAQAQDRPSSANVERRSSQRYTSRCHVADVAQAVLADMHRRTAQQQQQHPCSAVDIINVVDDAPAPRGEVEAYARQLLGGTGGGTAAGSTCTSVQQQQPQRRRRPAEPLEEKRVRNDKLKQLLQVQLQSGLVAPSFREGLRLIHTTQPFAPADLDCLFERTAE